jgi:hypothetical protein
MMIAAICQSRVVSALSSRCGMITDAHGAPPTVVGS